MKSKTNGAVPPTEEVIPPPPVVDGALAHVANNSMFLEDAGSNDFSKDDLAIPFVRVLQDGSPQVKKREPKYIEGSEAGMIFNTVTGQIWPNSTADGVTMIPIAYTPSFVEWKPNRGGFAKDHGADSSIMNATKKGGKDGKEDVLPNGNSVVRAGLYYVFILDEVTGGFSEAAFSLSGLGMTASRKWNTTIRSLRIPRDPQDLTKGSVEPAMFYMAYKVKTYLDQRDAGDSFQYDIKPYKPTVELGPLGTQIYMAAREFKKLITAGSVQVKHEQGEGDEKEGVPF